VQQGAARCIDIGECNAYIKSEVLASCDLYSFYSLATFPMKASLRLALLAAAASALSAGASIAGTPAAPTSIPTVGSGILGTAGSTGVQSGGLQGTFTYSGSTGQNNNFAVGTSTNFGVNASASSTADYKVQSTGTANVGGTQINLGIGSSNQIDALNRAGNPTNNGSTTTTDSNSGVISGKFNSVESFNTNATMKQIDMATGGTGQNLNDSASVGSLNRQSNTVEVTGIANQTALKMENNSSFKSDITARNASNNVGTTNSATANGSAGANLSTTATANSSSSAYTSTFIQAF